MPGGIEKRRHTKIHLTMSGLNSNVPSEFRIETKGLKQYLERHVRPLGFLGFNRWLRFIAACEVPIERKMAWH